MILGASIDAKFSDSLLPNLVNSAVGPIVDFADDCYNVAR